MNVVPVLLLYYFGYLIGNPMILVSGEYNVKEVVPSYLYHKFENVKENIFPQHLRIKVSLSRIAGTLLYTIDKNMNQMIVSLNDGLTITLGIEFRKKEIFIGIPELCNCQRCRYEILDIDIEIKDQINVKCNTGKIKSYTFNKIIAINEAYNIPKYNTSINITSTNEGYLWLVNTPYDSGVYPNPNQLSGCIFNVWYKNNAIDFQENKGNITRFCRKLCKDNICNKGDCYETYNGDPVCNCTKSFLNGIHCNKTISRLNIQSMQTQFQFAMFKLSWNSSSNEILKMSNSQFQIRLRAIGRILQFEYHYGQENNVNITSVLSQRYKMNKEYILIAMFQPKYIDIHYFNGSWFKKQLPSVSDLSKEEITSIILQSGDGKISLAYKDNPILHAWNILEIKDYEEIIIHKNDKNMNSTTSILRTILKALKNDNKVGKNFTENHLMAMLWIIILVFIIQLFGNVFSLFKFCINKQNKRNSKKRSKKPRIIRGNDEENIELVLPENETTVNSNPMPESLQIQQLGKETSTKLFELSERIKQCTTYQINILQQIPELVTKTSNHLENKFLSKLDEIHELLTKGAIHPEKELPTKEFSHYQRKMSGDNDEDKDHTLSQIETLHKEDDMSELEKDDEEKESSLKPEEIREIESPTKELIKDEHVISEHNDENKEVNLSLHEISKKLDEISAKLEKDHEGNDVSLKLNEIRELLKNVKMHSVTKPSAEENETPKSNEENKDNETASKNKLVEESSPNNVTKPERESVLPEETVGQLMENTDCEISKKLDKILDILEKERGYNNFSKNELISRPETKEENESTEIQDKMKNPLHEVTKNTVNQSQYEKLESHE